MEQAPLTIFLSPHFDDIALSCGAIAARLSRMGSKCICIVVFAAPASTGSISRPSPWACTHSGSATPA